jgi:CheY-like chemotaxis protein
MLAPLDATTDDEDVTRQVLIADDDAEVREVLRETLEWAGLAVIEAADGRAALERLSEAREDIALVLLDLRMPVMSGAEFLAVKNADASLRAIPVVIVSATEPDEVLLHGAAGFLRKPTELTALVDVVRRFCL